MVSQFRKARLPLTIKTAWKARSNTPAVWRVKRNAVAIQGRSPSFVAGTTQQTSATAVMK
jgi:hypothetical protein